MRALITGISGQDGSYLAEHLLSLGYEVHGMVRRHSTAEDQDTRIKHLPITTHYGDVTDTVSIRHILHLSKPDEIYNLAAQSHVRVSFDVPDYTTQVNGVGVRNMLEGVLQHCPRAKFYQASSSEMFGLGVDDDGCQRETTPMNPTSPYGVAKLFGYNTVRHFRRAYGMFAVNGILFNHASPRRGSNFVEAKIVKTLVQIKLGLAESLVLGNLDAKRDWGASEDYVQAMHLMLHQPEPDDWVVATGETHSVRMIVSHVLKRLGLPWSCVTQDERFLRPEELPYLCGDASRIRAIGWKPTYTLQSLLDEMISHWMERYGAN